MSGLRRHIYIRNTTQIFKKNEILSFPAIWMELERTLLSEVRNKTKDFTHIWDIEKKKQRNQQNQAKKPENSLKNCRSEVARQEGEGWGSTCR